MVPSGGLGLSTPTQKAWLRQSPWPLLPCAPPLCETVGADQRRGYHSRGTHTAIVLLPCALRKGAIVPSPPCASPLCVTVDWGAARSTQQGAAWPPADLNCCALAGSSQVSSDVSEDCGLKVRKREACRRGPVHHRRGLPPQTGRGGHPFGCPPTALLWLAFDFVVTFLGFAGMWCFRSEVKTVRGSEAKCPTSRSRLRRHLPRLAGMRCFRWDARALDFVVTFLGSRDVVLQVGR